MQQRHSCPKKWMQLLHSDGNWYLGAAGVAIFFYMHVALAETGLQLYDDNEINFPDELRGKVVMLN